MSAIWQNATHVKLFLSGIGLAVILATSSPQTADVAQAYLAQRGYTGISLKAPAPWHGRGQKRFPFEARAADGRPVTGELSLGSFAWFYTISLTHPQPPR